MFGHKMLMSTVSVIAAVPIGTGAVQVSLTPSVDR